MRAMDVQGFRVGVITQTIDYSSADMDMMNLFQYALGDLANAGGLFLLPLLLLMLLVETAVQPPKAPVQTQTRGRKLDKASREGCGMCSC